MVASVTWACRGFRRWRARSWGRARTVAKRSRSRSGLGRGRAGEGGDGRPGVAVVLAQGGLAAWGVAALVGGEGPVFERADARADASAAAGAVDPEHLGVAALDGLQ